MVLFCCDGPNCHKEGKPTPFKHPIEKLWTAKSLPTGWAAKIVLVNGEPILFHVCSQPCAQGFMKEIADNEIVITGE